MSNAVKKQTLYLLAIMIVCGLATNALAGEHERGSSRERPRRSMHEKSEEMIERIAEKDPGKAEELRKLREEDPEKFREQMNQHMQKMRPEQGRRGGGMMGYGGKGAGRGEDESRSRGRKAHWKERMQKQHEEFVKWLEENHPKAAKNLEKLKEKNLGEYMKEVFEKHKKYDEIIEAEKKSPEYATVLKEDMKLKQTRDKLVREIKSADAEEKADLQAELRETIGKRFDIVIKKKEFKYKYLKQKLEKLKQQVDKRQAELEKLVQSKDSAIAERMKELIGEAEKINWD